MQSWWSSAGGGTSPVVADDGPRAASQDSPLPAGRSEKDKGAVHMHGLIPHPPRGIYHDMISGKVMHFTQILRNLHPSFLQSKFMSNYLDIKKQLTCPTLWVTV